MLVLAFTEKSVLQELHVGEPGGTLNSSVLSKVLLNIVLQKSKSHLLCKTLI